MRDLRPRLAALILTLAALAGPAAARPIRAEARVAAAAATFAATQPRLAAGAATPELVYTWSVRWLDAQRDQPLKGKALAAAARAHLDRMIALETAVTAMVNAGTLPTIEGAAATYYRAEAELWVERKGKR
ncbi:MAG: hypothetical protein IPL61_33325 [Myxococcales bacterium]|nr:hypothetical protein [Myxococcales bacterium]